jgi:hypothetical protein
MVPQYDKSQYNLLSSRARSLNCSKTMKGIKEKMRRCHRIWANLILSTNSTKPHVFNPLSPELNPICYLRALLDHDFLHISRIRVKSLPIRLLMSYIYIEHLFLMFLDHTQRRSTVDRTPPDEWSARRRDLYLTTHDIYNRQISMPPVGFELTRSVDELITRPEESYGLCCVVVCYLETSRLGAPYIYDIRNRRRFECSAINEVYLLNKPQWLSSTTFNPPGEHFNPGYNTFSYYVWDVLVPCQPSPAKQ